MTIDHNFAIKKLKGIEEAYVIYSSLTQMPFVTCDDNSFNDQFWIFSDENKADAFMGEYRREGTPLYSVKMASDELKLLYVNIFDMGINEVVFVDGEIQHFIDMNQFIKRPDMSKLPEKQRPVNNPQLVLSLMYFFQEMRKPGQEMTDSLNELQEEIFVNLLRGKFLMPVEVEKGKNGQQELKMFCLDSKEKGRLQPLFTDSGELIRFMKVSKKQTPLLPVTFEKLPTYLAEGVTGYVINPQGINMLMSKKMMESLLKK